MHHRSSWMTEELDTFRDQFRKFLAKDLAPHAEKWRSQKMVDRSAWRGLGEMAIVLVEQYVDFARELGDHFAVMDRGQVVYATPRAEMDEGALRRALAI